MIEDKLDQDIINDEPIEQSNEEVEVEEQSELGEVDQGSEEILEEEGDLAGEILGDEEGEEALEEGDEEELEEESKEPEKHKVKINNEEYELTTDELKGMASKAAGADEAFREASKIKEQAKTLLNSLKDKSKLADTLASLGVNVDDFVSEYVSGVIDYENMSEDAKRAHDYKLQLSKVEKERQAEVELQKKREYNEQVEKEKQYFTDVINKTIEETPILPKNEFVVGKMAEYMGKFMEAGVANPPMDRVAKQVLKDYQESTTHFLSKMDQKDLLEFLGEENARKVSSTYGKKLKKNVYVKGKAPVKKQQSNDNKPINMRDFRDLVAQDL